MVGSSGTDERLDRLRPCIRGLHYKSNYKLHIPERSCYYYDYHSSSWYFQQKFPSSSPPILLPAEWPPHATSPFPLYISSALPRLSYPQIIYRLEPQFCSCRGLEPFPPMAALSRRTNIWRCIYFPTERCRVVYDNQATKFRENTQKICCPQTGVNRER